ncbi:MULTISPECIES: hypothetical protein [Sorangium]|uniref:hypothetical protein n=1 Tax=Sorangium TaxID=39643 RepID=UPI00101A8015|nr:MULTISPECIES: hypothetical protein [Sorangium]
MFAVFDEFKSTDPIPDLGVTLKIPSGQDVVLRADSAEELTLGEPQIRTGTVDAIETWDSRKPAVIRNLTSVLRKCRRYTPWIAQRWF